MTSINKLPRYLLSLSWTIGLCGWFGSPLAADHPDGGSNKRIALSFDDAPRADTALLSGSDRTQRLIATLDRAEVRGAVFFVVTQRLDELPDRAERLRAYVAAGHFLGNHSHSHTGLSRSSVADYVADLDRAGRRLAEFDGVLPLYRFPYLDEGRDSERRDALRAALAVRGLGNGYVTVDNYDWYLDALANKAKAAHQPIDMDALGRLYVDTLLSAVTFYDAIAIEHLGRSPSHVLLLHENDLAALYVADLVAALRSRGWQIISALEAYRDPINSQWPDTLFNGQGRVAALAHAKGAPTRQLVHELEDEQALDQAFASAVLIATGDDAVPIR